MSALSLAVLVGCAPAPDLTPTEWDILEKMHFRHRPKFDDDHPPETAGVGEGPAEPPEDGSFCDGRSWFNPWWNDPAAVALGQTIFFDLGFSGPLREADPFSGAPAGAEGTISCNTCHDAWGGGADPRGSPTSFGGEGFSPSNAPTILNSGYRANYSWTHVCDTLWGQVRRPLMRSFHGLKAADCAATGGPAACVGDRIRSAYATPYQSVFGEAPDDDHDVVDHVAMALEAYLRTHESSDSAFDCYLEAGTYAGRDPEALTPDAQRGARLFVGKAACDTCHWGPMFSDGEPHHLGVAAIEAGAEDGYQTPSLRDVARTAPYMHDGSLATLEDVVWFYNDGGGSASAKDPAVVPLGLDDEEQRDLVAFLQALTGATPGLGRGCDE